MREDGLAGAVASLVEPAIEGLGFRLVRVTASGRQGMTIQIMAERPDGTISIDDCETISRDLSPLLDTADLIPGAWRLEVSSPGIDRPLVRPSDFEDWAGFEARLELKSPVDGRKRFRGHIEGFSDGEARMECEIKGADGAMGRHVLGFPLHLIDEARLVLTDELIREALTRSKRAGRGDGSAGDGTPMDTTGSGSPGRDDM